MNLYFTGFLCFLYVLYTLKVHLIVKNKYEKFQDLNQFVSTRYKNKFRILYITFSIIGKMLWLKFLQWINNSVEHVDKHYILSYVMNGKLYKKVLTFRKGPSLVLLVTDDKHEDVSEQIIPYLGPNDDWHGYPFTPSFFNKESLTFETSDGKDPKTFLKEERIDLN